MRIAVVKVFTIFGYILIFAEYMRRHKFRNDRSNRCWDVARKWFSKWRPSAILDF